MELLVQVLALGETPTYQMREHCTDKDKKEGRQKVHFLGVFCLDHLKLEVTLQN